MGVHFDIAPEFEMLIDMAAFRKNIQLITLNLNIPQETELTIAFVDDAAIQQLNLEFRGIDSPTDVLSFPANEVNPEDGSAYIGDVIISMDTAKKQSEQQSISTLDEIYLLIIHGILHLLGYDHDSVENKDIMWTKQSELLQILHSPANPDRYSL